MAVNDLLGRARKMEEMLKRMNKGNTPVEQSSDSDKILVQVRQNWGGRGQHVECHV